MIKKIKVLCKFGIHAGIASELYAIACQNPHTFVFINYQDKTSSILSFVQILSLNVNQYDEVTVIVDGENEHRIMDEIAKILNECSEISETYTYDEVL